MHYRRERLYGDPTVVQVIRGDDVARFRSKVGPADDNGCQPWTGVIDRDGYGRFRLPGANEPAHRTAHRLLVGPIPDGYQVDHVWARGCRRRDCVNPAHLEAVTPAENSRRGEPARRTHCPRGHAYDAANTSLTSGTGRTCVTCNRARNRSRSC